MNELPKNNYNVGKNNPMFGKKRLKHSLNISGCGNPMFGKKHSKETLLKMSEIRKNGNFSGKNNSNYKDGRTLKENFCVDCNKLISVNATRCWEHSCEERGKRIRGEEHFNWQGGLNYQEYGTNWTNQLKQQIRERDNHKCQICNKNEIDNGRKLDVHHIDYNKKNCEESNLISLCISCHMKTNHNRELWVEYFKNNKELICQES